MLTKFSLWGYLILLIKYENDTAFKLARESSCRAVCVDLRVITGAAAGAGQEWLRCLYWLFPCSCLALDPFQASPTVADVAVAAVEVATVVVAVAET